MAVININRNQFEEMVHSGKTVLVEFSAPWCVYCRRLAPALESVAEEYKDTLVFTAVNIDNCHIASSFPLFDYSISNLK